MPRMKCHKCQVLWTEKDATESPCWVCGEFGADTLREAQKRQSAWLMRFREGVRQ